MKRLLLTLAFALPTLATAQMPSNTPGVERLPDGQVRTTGIFVPFSTVGLVDIYRASSNDTSAPDARTSAANRAADGFNPKAVAVGNSRVEGITHLAVAPTGGSTVFSGTGAVVTTDGSFSSILVPDAFLMASLGESDGTSRGATLAELRRALREASTTTVGAGEPLLTPEDRAALRPVLAGDIPLVVAANRASDLAGLARLKASQPDLDIIVLGAKEAWQVADLLAESGIKVMIDPHDNLPDSFDSVGARSDNVLLLDRAGVPYAFTTASADIAHNVRVVAQHAGNAVGEGLPWSKAWAAITTTPASWFGVDLSGTEVVWSGDPLELTSRPVSMRIDGEDVPLESRQKALRERYFPREDERAFKYR